MKEKERNSKEGAQEKESVIRDQRYIYWCFQPPTFNYIKSYYRENFQHCGKD